MIKTTVGFHNFGKLHKNKLSSHFLHKGAIIHTKFRFLNINYSSCIKSSKPIGMQGYCLHSSSFYIV